MSLAPAPRPAEMGPDDRELLDLAERLLGDTWVDGRHEVATALRTPDGQVFTGVHLEGSCRRSSICAEGVAMGAARAGTRGPLQVSSIVSVQVKPAGQFRVIAPCGVCRELISDYAPDATVWVSAADGTVLAAGALELLPEKSRRTW